MAELTAAIFDVERFATHDGQGIRTTVFFKGCPLRCAWCHNPEGIETARWVLYREQACIHCGTCQQGSRAGGIEVQDGRLLLHPECPEDWETLVEACPSGALCWDSRRVSVDQLVEEARRDMAFFRHGGGVTVSGGEPLLQADFVQAFLTRLQQQGIHTAMETALLVPQRQLMKVLPALDHLYADCKLLDPVQHRNWTGQENRQILDNIRWLLQSDFRDKVVIRTPMIPGITAQGENIAAIARFLYDCWPETRYELLNYNPLAAAKYPLVRRDYCFKENPGRYTRQEMMDFASLAVAQGLGRTTIDE